MVKMQVSYILSTFVWYWRCLVFNYGLCLTVYYFFLCMRTTCPGFPTICLFSVALCYLKIYHFFSGTIKVISVKLSKSGSPLVVLATRHAFLFDMNVKCWLRVADDFFPASNFSSSWSLGSIQSGELAALQVDLRKYLARKPGWTRCVLINLLYIYIYSL